MPPPKPEGPSEDWASSKAWISLKVSACGSKRSSRAPYPMGSFAGPPWSYHALRALPFERHYSAAPLPNPSVMARMHFAGVPIPLDLPLYLPTKGSSPGEEITPQVWKIQIALPNSQLVLHTSPSLPYTHRGQSGRLQSPHVLQYMLGGLLI